MTDLTISAPFQGTILAPNATIRITQNQDGTIIGTNVILDAATNRWDLTKYLSATMVQIRQTQATVHT